MRSSWLHLKLKCSYKLCGHWKTHSDPLAETIWKGFRVLFSPPSVSATIYECFSGCRSLFQISCLAHQVISFRCSLRIMLQRPTRRLHSISMISQKNPIRTTIMRNRSNSSTFEIKYAETSFSLFLLLFLFQVLVAAVRMLFFCYQ